MLAIHDARATGPAIGVSAEGYIDRPKNEIALKGTLVPLFGINSVLGIIPLLGDLLVSKPGEGIIGMTYTVAGNADEPQRQRQSALDGDAGNPAPDFRRPHARRRQRAVQRQARAA